jgi:hypothetical protein
LAGIGTAGALCSTGIQLLLAPDGRGLAEIGSLAITTGSLAMGLRKGGVTLEGFFMLSTVLIRGGGDYGAVGRGETTERRNNGVGRWELLDGGEKCPPPVGFYDAG